MFGRSSYFALALALAVGLAVGLTVPAPSFAQDAGVSGIRGAGSAGGLNNSVNDPSGIGNAAKVSPPPPPSMAAPTVPSAAPLVSTRVSPGATSRVRNNRRAMTVSRSEVRRNSPRASPRTRSKPADGKFNICRGC